MEPLEGPDITDGEWDQINQPGVRSVLPSSPQLWRDNNWSGGELRSGSAPEDWAREVVPPEPRVPPGPAPSLCPVTSLFSCAL